MFSRIYQSARSLVYNPQTKRKEFSPSSKRVMIQASTKHDPLEEEDLNDDNTINVFVPTPNSKRRKRAEPESSDSDEAKVITPSPKKRKFLPVRIKEGDDELLSNSRPVVEVLARKMIPEADMTSVKAQPSSKKTHRRFDSEEHTEEFFSTAREQAVVNDEEEDSDDDAPEAIGMQEAAETIKSREQDTAKAVKE
jgi:U3 small nucleolar RNA-associated protein 16